MPAFGLTHLLSALLSPDSVSWPISPPLAALLRSDPPEGSAALTSSSRWRRARRGAAGAVRVQGAIWGLGMGALALPRAGAAGAAAKGRERMRNRWDAMAAGVEDGATLRCW
jgi:hypothetical protein